jgi:8-oxo-dGTP pyrophosphatase MutT (NUDIX family)
MRVTPAHCAAALREAREEIGLDPANVEVLADAAPHETVTGYTVTPVLARVRSEFEAVPDPARWPRCFVCRWTS